MVDVLIVEDDLILLDFLAQEVANQINSSAHTIRKAFCLEKARYMLAERQPDWLLLDLALPDGSGVDLAEEFVRDHGDAKILILTAQADQYLLPAPLLTNVHSLINKAEGLAPLRQAIWEISRQIDSNLPDLSVLTRRQTQFLKLLGDGLDTAEIAVKMNITFATAQTHRRQITRKLGIKGAALTALSRNLPI